MLETEHLPPPSTTPGRRFADETAEPIGRDRIEGAAS
jgi:hypothetical protein